MAKLISVVHSNWCHSFENLQFSSKEFYNTVEQIIKDRQIPDTTYSRVSHSEAGLFSSKREYLRVQRKQYVFDVCAAPFGKDFFVSWWFGETTGYIRDLLSRIPIIGQFLAKASEYKTYYQIDSESMWKGSIRASVGEAIDLVTKEKGIRALSELEKKPVDSSH